MLAAVNMELIGEFRTVNEPVLARCLHPECGAEYPIWIGTLQKGGGCNHCGRRRAAETQRLPATDIAAQFDAAQFTLASEYVNNHTLNQLQCQRCQHRFRRSYKAFSKGSRRCPQCDAIPGSRPLVADEEVRATFLDAGLLMTGVYTGFDKPVTATCLKCGNEDCSPTLANLRQGQGGCYPCGRRKAGDARLHPIGAVEAIFEARDLEFIGPYKDAVTKTPGRCKRCGNLVAPKLNHLLTRPQMRGCMACGYASRRVEWTTARDVEAVLYFLDFNVDGERFCKVGIGKVGSGRVEQFISSAGARVRQLRYGPLADCYAAEQAILVAHADDRYLPVTPRLKSGHTECFRASVMIDLSQWLPGGSDNPSSLT